MDDLQVESFGAFILAAALKVAIGLLVGLGTGVDPSMIVPVDAQPPNVSAQAEAFHVAGEEKIYVPTYTALYKKAMKGDRDAEIRLAAVIAHEHFHVMHGADEGKAYDTEIYTLQRLGASNDAIQNKMRAKQEILHRVKTTGASVDLNAKNPNARR